MFRNDRVDTIDKANGQTENGAVQGRGMIGSSMKIQHRFHEAPPKLVKDFGDNITPKALRTGADKIRRSTLFLSGMREPYPTIRKCTSVHYPRAHTSTDNFPL